MKEYVYGMRLRGFSPGCQPKNGLIRREDSEISRYWDYCVYDRELTEEECNHYSLDLLDIRKIN